MVLVISQQTFDEAVQENINDLGLSPEEAVTEAVSQFEAQGVDLSQIVTQPLDGASLAVISAAVKKLSEGGSQEELVDNLNTLKGECDKGVLNRVSAGKCGAYNVILDILTNKDTSQDVRTAALRAMLALMTKQPDLLDDRGIGVILSTLGSGTDPVAQKLALKWAKECCVMHEMNRQHLFEANVMDRLGVLLREGSAEVLKDVLLVLRALVLDDDIRVEFGKAHEHARIIAGEHLAFIASLLTKYKIDESLVNDLMQTIAALSVRTEFCKNVEDVGGLETIQEVMTKFISSDKINRQGFKLLKVLAGNDECKAHMIQKGLAPVIANSLITHKGTVPTATAGLNCVSALSLRSPENSKALFEASIPEVIVEIMRQHPQEKAIQKTASWAIRNMVSRSRYQNAHFLELGVEDLLKNSLGKFKDFEYDIKAALRDLDCNVDLKEEWTGKGGKLSSEALTGPHGTD